MVPKNESKQGQGQQVVHVNIYAADAKSFTDMMRRNPQAVLGPLKEALNYGDQDLRNSIRNA